MSPQLESLWAVDHNLHQGARSAVVVEPVGDTDFNAHTLDF